MRSMTTNFALSLSFEGIELLHRVQHGWKRVGRADVEDENLDAALADLRAKAEAMAPDGLRTKLIIPLDQIKYVAIDSTQTTEDDINAKLDGATPYALNELVIDCERFGGRTHIAAVARETLAEAETFAHAHGFQPVCFVAVPEPFTFQKEVFFGPTSMMQDILGPGEEVTRDPLPVMVVGTRIKSRLLVFDLPEDVIPPSDDFDLADALAETGKAATAPASAETDEAPPSEGFDLAAALAPFVDNNADETAEQAETTVEQPLLPLDIEEPKPAVAEVVPEVEAKWDSDEPVAREATEKTHPAVNAEPAEETSIQCDDVALETGAQLTAQIATPRLLDRIIPEVTAPIVALVQPVATADTAPEPPAIPAPALIPAKLSLAKPPLLDLVIAEYHGPSPRRVRRQRSRLIALPPPKIVAAPKPADVAARPAQPPVATNTNRRPILIAGVIAASLALVGVVGWTTMRDADPVADPVAAAVEDALQEAAPETVASTTAAPAEEAELTGPAPSAPQIDVTDFNVSADEDADAGIAVETFDTQPTAAPPQVLATVAAQDARPDAVEPAPAPPPEEQAVASVGAPVLRGRVLSPADAARIYNATGVWQRAPRFVDVPGTTSTDGLILPFSETVPDRAVQPQDLTTDNLATDLSFLAPADPPPADVAFPLDEDGFILATPEGTLTPEGAVVIAGAPDLTLRLRPELTEADLARMALLAPAPEGVVIVAGRPDVNPPLRPANAALPAPEQEATVVVADENASQDAPTPGGVSLSTLQSEAAPVDPALTDARPEPRPSELASTAGLADPGTPDITSIIAEIEAEEAATAFVDATPQAVVASLRPALRPNNFDRVVAAARARQESQRTAPAAAAPVRTAAPVAPQNYAPVPGGVARAATQEDVIRLREINLIGVYGRPNARRALVRLSNGRYVRVEVGSALDGGQVTAIGESALNYVKRGRTYALQLPSG